jgi:hypothetical protein
VVSVGYVRLEKVVATSPRVSGRLQSVSREIFQILGCILPISHASLWSPIFNIRLLMSETRFELA